MSETNTITQDDDIAIAPASSDPATGTDQTETNSVEPQTTEPPKKDWRDNIIAKTAYEAREAKRQNEVLAAQLRQYQQQQPAQPTPEGFVPIAEVEARAAEFAKATKLADDCNAIADYGARHVAGWETASGNFQLMGVIPDAVLEVIADQGKEAGARLYAQLGNNPNEAQRIFAMSPVRMGAAIERMANPTETVAVSKAPPPITPITPGSAARSSDEPDEKDAPAWTKWFIEQRNKR
jgi:hypothetical protein